MRQSKSPIRRRRPTHPSQRSRRQSQRQSRLKNQRQLPGIQSMPFHMNRSRKRKRSWHQKQKSARRRSLQLQGLCRLQFKLLLRRRLHQCSSCSRSRRQSIRHAPQHLRPLHRRQSSSKGFSNISLTRERRGCMLQPSML